MRVIGENGSIWKKAYPSANVSITNPTLTDAGLKPGLCSLGQQMSALRHNSLISFS